MNKFIELRFAGTVKKVMVNINAISDVVEIDVNRCQITLIGDGNPFTVAYSYEDFLAKLRLNDDIDIIPL